MQSGYLGYFFKAAVSWFLGLKSSIPPPILFVQATQKQVNAMVFFFVRIYFWALTYFTLTLLNYWCGHFCLLFGRILPHLQIYILYLDAF